MRSVVCTAVIAAVIVFAEQGLAQEPSAPSARPQASASQAEELFENSQFQAAAEAFAARLRTRPDDAQLAYNLALARWRAGDAEGAETAAEQAATLSSGALAPLRDGILGNLRFDAAQAMLASTEPPSDLEAALGLARQAVTSFRRGALAGDSPQPSLARNLERALALVDEIQRRIDEQQKDEQQQEDQDGEPDPDAKSDEQKPDESKDPKEGEDGEPSPDQKPSEQSEPNADDPSEPQPEPDAQQEPDPPSDPAEQPEPSEQDEPSPSDETTPQPEPGAEQPPLAEQQSQPMQLSEAQTQRLLQQLEALDRQRIELRKAQAQRRPRTERDW